MKALLAEVLLPVRVDIATGVPRPVTGAGVGVGFTTGVGVGVAVGFGVAVGAGVGVGDDVAEELAQATFPVLAFNICK